jgi:hypothetical protein
MMAKSKYDNCCKVRREAKLSTTTTTIRIESMGWFHGWGNGQGSKDNKVLFHDNLIISQQLASIISQPNNILIKAHNNFTNVS